MDAKRVPLGGIARVGLAWAMAGAAAFGLIALVIGRLDPHSVDPGESIPGLAAIGVAVGLASGVGFAVALWAVDRGRAVPHIPVHHGLAFGLIGGAALPLLTTMPDGNAILTGPLGAVFGVATVALAHKSAATPSPGQILRLAEELIRGVAGTHRPRAGEEGP
jgi:hypothetical protein